MPDPIVTIVGENQPPSSSDSSFNIDFGALKDKAAEMLAMSDEPEAVTPVSEPVKVEPEPAKEAAKPAPEVKVDEPVPLSLSDDQLVTIQVDGEEKTLPWKEARGQISGGLKFTKNMQQLAAEKKEFESNKQHLATLEADRERLVGFLNNGEMVMQFVAAKFPHLLQGPAQSGQEQPQSGYDPNEIATVGQARGIAEIQARQFAQVLDETKQELQKEIARSGSKIEFERERQGHVVAIDSTLQSIFAQHPVLNSIPDVEDIIRFNVAKMAPTTQAEAVAAFRTVSQGIVDQLQKHYQADKKIQVVSAAKAKLESKTIEPAVGVPPSIPPTNFKNKDGQVDWKLVMNMAKDYSG